MKGGIDDLPALHDHLDIVNRPHVPQGIAIDSDDGIGLPMQPPASSGFGLIGIRERIATRSGTMQLQPRPGGGTTLLVTIPLATNSEEVRQ